MMNLYKHWVMIYDYNLALSDNDVKATGGLSLKSADS